MESIIVGEHNRDSVLGSIANAIADYRQGEIPAPTTEHIDRWIQQFDTGVQERILAELDYVLKRTYISKANVESFLAGLVKNPKLTGADPSSFWKSVQFLDIQDVGKSQRDMLEMFDQILQTQCGLRIKDCGISANTFVYLDDALFSGNRMRHDLTTWINSSAPQDCQVHIIVIAIHSNGGYYAQKGIGEEAAKSKKTVRTHWWRCVEFENLRSNMNISDVLWPSRVPDDELTTEYVKMLSEAGYPPVLRGPGNVGKSKVFSSEEGRDLIEQEFLKAGTRIRSMCPHLHEYQRPLGNVVLRTLGFGALLVTFRNCPNNCPLAFWAGDPWYPLFPRRTN